MSDDARPTRVMATTSDRFSDIAESTGKELERRFGNDLDLDKEPFDLLSIEVHRYRDVLDPIMQRFETGEFRKRHPDGELRWGTLSVTIRAASFDKEFWGKRSEGKWLLALAVRDGNDVGRSLDMSSEFSVNRGEIFLQYGVKQDK